MPNGNFSRNGLASLRQHQYSQEFQLVGSTSRLRYGEHADTYRLLRTLTWLAGVPPMGNAAHRSAITDIWR